MYFVLTQDGDYLNAAHIVRISVGYNCEAMKKDEQFKMTAVMSDGEKARICYARTAEQLRQEASRLFNSIIFTTDPERLSYWQ